MLSWKKILTAILVNTRRGGIKVADYKKMYAVLCGAVDNVIDELETIPLALPAATSLRNALLQTEEIYIDTCMYSEPKYGTNIVELKTDTNAEED